MKQRRKKTDSCEHSFRVWTYEQAQNAVPYLTLIAQSLREHYITAQGHRLRLERLQERPGRPDRAMLLARQEATQAAEEAEEMFNAALKELWRLNIYCLDPVQGQTLIPFAHGDQLAWFLFDLFDTNKISAWRYHSDSVETRRPLAEAFQDPPSPSLAV